MVRGIGNCCCQNVADGGCDEPELFTWPFANGLDGPLIGYQFFAAEPVPQTASWWLARRELETDVVGSGGSFTTTVPASQIVGGGSDEGSAMITRPLNFNVFDDDIAQVSWLSQLVTANTADPIGTSWAAVGFAPPPFLITGAIDNYSEYAVPLLRVYHVEDLATGTYSVKLGAGEGSTLTIEGTDEIDVTCGSAVNITLKVTPASTEAALTSGSFIPRPYYAGEEGAVDTCIQEKEFTVELTVNGSLVASGLLSTYQPSPEDWLITEWPADSVNGRGYLTAQISMGRPVGSGVSTSHLQFSGLSIT